MKLKYYLRGVGIGIVVTAMILSVTKKTEKLTDAQIKMRALELGMVEESVLSDLNDKSEATKEEQTLKETVEDVSEEANMPLEDESSDGSKELEEAEETQPEESESEDQEKPQEASKEDAVSDEGTVNVMEDNKTDSEVKQEENAEVVKTDSNEMVEEIQQEKMENYIIISVEPGNGSEIISQKLFDAGLIHSTTEYNKFLVENGYDRRLRTGNHEIPINSTQEEMAKILCGMQ